MANDLAVPDDERKEKAQDLWTRLVELRSAGEALTIDLGEALKEAHDGAFHKDFGFSSFEALTQELFGLGKTQAYQYIKIVEGVIQSLPADLSARCTNGPKAIPLKILAAVHFGHGDSPLPQDEIQRLRKLSDDELRAEIIRLGYDRKRMGGRGPSDISRRLVSRNTHRDQSKQVILEREKRKNAESANEELLRVVKQLQEELKRKNEILMADDKTRAYELQVEQMAQTINAYHTAEHRSAAQKVDHQAAVRRITELRYHVIRLLQEFRDGIHLPTLETCAWLTVTVRDIAADLQRTYDFIASDALKEFSETGAPVPLEDAATALEQLNKSIVADLTRLAAERGDIRIVGKPGTDEHGRTRTDKDGGRPGKKD